MKGRERGPSSGWVRGAFQTLRHGRGGASKPSQIAETGIWRVTNVFVDHYAFRSGASVVLIDTGFDPEGRPVDALLEALGAGRNDVSDILLTHAHPDHVAAAPLFEGARVHVGAADVARLAGEEAPRKRAERAFRRTFPTPSVRATHPLTGRCEVPVGDGTERVVVLPLPGDTGGACAFFLRGTLLVGDVVDLRGGRLCLAARYATDDPDQNYRSVAGLPGDVRELDLDWIATSHGGVSPPGAARALIEDVAARATRKLVPAGAGTL